MKEIFKKVKLPSLRGFGGRGTQFAAGLIGGLVIVAVVFALPLKTVKSENIETYYVTELRQEPYTETLPYTAEQVKETTQVIAAGEYPSVPYGITFPFTVEEPGARLIGSYENPFTGTFKVTAFPNRIVWEKLGSRGVIDVMIDPGEYQAKFQENVMWGQDVSIYLALQRSEVQQVMQYREVTYYRDVPVQVEKQRTITAQEKISLWKYLFS